MGDIYIYLSQSDNNLDEDDNDQNDDEDAIWNFEPSVV